MLSDGTAWRPLLHVEDMANAFLLTLESSEDKVSGEIFNVGSNNDNYIVKDKKTRTLGSSKNHLTPSFNCY